MKVKQKVVSSVVELDQVRDEAMQFAGIGLYRYGMDGKIRFMDKGAFTIFDLDQRFPNPDAVTGQDIAAFAVYAQRGEMRKEVQARGEVRGWEWTFTTLKGRQKWVIEDSYLVHDSHTGEDTIQVVMRDLTELKQTENMLRAREEEYRETLDCMTEAIHLVDPELRIIFMNKAFHTFAQRADVPSEAIGRHLYEVFPFLSDEVRRQYEEVLKTGQPLRTEERTIVGEKEYYTETYKMPVFEKGVLKHILTVVRDKTAEQTADDALRKALNDALASGRALKESEEKFRTLVEMFPHAVCIFQGGRALFANEAAKAMFHYHKGPDVAGEDVTAFISTRVREQLRQFTEARARGERWVPEHYETILCRADGEEFPVEIFVRMIEYDGKPATQVIIADITERKQAQEALRQSEQRYREILANIQEGYYEVDLQGNFTFCNKAACDILGYEKGEILGLNFRAYYAESDAGKVYDTYRRVLETGEPVKVLDWAVRRKDGATAILEVSVSLMSDTDGNPIGFRGIARDVTEKKHAETALRESEERFRDIFESANDIIYSHDLNGHVLTLNRAGERITGYLREEAREMNIMSVIAPEYLPLAQRMADLKTLSDEPTRYEIEIQAKDGRRVPVEVSTRTMFRGGQPIGVLGIARDITERKHAEQERQRLEAQIQHAQKLEGLGVLAGGIAHDFNNLLVGILGYAGLALSKMPPESVARAYVERIEESAQRAAELTNQMLAYSGRGTFVVQPLNVSRLARDMGHLLSASISKKATLHYDCPPDVPLIRGDVAQLHQVLMNLITNASDALEDKAGVITVATSAVKATREYLAGSFLDDDLPPGLYVCIEISDTGCGMDKETLPKIFDPFFSTKFAGRGLGLAAVLGIVRGHKGAVRVYSEPGKGTIFKVLLPADTASVEPSKNAPANDGRPDLQSWRSSGHILVVDDERAAREVAREALELHGFNILMAENGREAVDIFRVHSDTIVAVLLDLTMPEMNGEEAARLIHEIRPDVPVILSSGYTERDAVDRFTGARPRAFVQKPYLIADLIEKVRKVLETER